MTRSTTTSLARKMPLWRSMASTSVVLPWSTWATIAMLRTSGRICEIRWGWRSRSLFGSASMALCVIEGLSRRAGEVSSARARPSVRAISSALLRNDRVWRRRIGSISSGSPARSPGPRPRSSSSTSRAGDLLELTLDDPRGARDLPRAAEAEGHHVVSTEALAGRWIIVLEK